jgi:putative hydrolase of the HAD superfamily
LRLRQESAGGVSGRLAGTTTDLVYEAIWETGFEQLGDSGALDASEYLQGFGERIGYSLSLEEWLTARRHSMKANTTVLNIVGNLRGSVDLAVLTNNTSLVVDHIDVLFPELRPLFGSSIYASAQFKVAKPDPECFRLCLSKLQVAPGTALFVDDLPENVAGAREAGLFAHHYTVGGDLQASPFRLQSFPGDVVTDRPVAWLAEANVERSLRTPRRCRAGRIDRRVRSWL